MKISLERIDSRGATLALPGAGDERVAVRAAVGLRGELETAADRLTLSKGHADSLALDALRLAFDTLLLSSTSGMTLEAVGLGLEQHTGHLSLNVTAGALDALDLSVVVEDVAVSGKVTLGDVRLEVRDAEGSLAAQRVVLGGFLLRIGDLELAADSLQASGVVIRWGAAGFSLAADSASAASFHVTSGDTRITLGDLIVSALAVGGGKVGAASASAALARVALTFGGPVANAKDETAKPARSTTAPPPALDAKPPFFDLRVLDGLAGEIDVDVEVDLTVPILGSRRATHRLRVPVEHGAIDYRALERNLSALENALLDFSVRDGALCLERINPLFPVRGHGKPIVRWPLDEADLALAQHERVRLAVLPDARLAEDDGAPREREPGDKKSAIALRTLAFHRVDVKLALDAEALEARGQLRLHRVASLVVQGNVVHAPSDAAAGTPPPAGSLLGELKGLAATVVGLSLGTSKLDVASLTLAAASPIEVAFAGIHATQLQVDLAGLALHEARLDLGS